MLKIGAMFRVKVSIGDNDQHQTANDAEFQHRFIFWIKPRIKSNTIRKFDIMLGLIRKIKSPITSDAVTLCRTASFDYRFTVHSSFQHCHGFHLGLFRLKVRMHRVNRQSHGMTQTDGHTLLFVHRIMHIYFNRRV